MWKKPAGYWGGLRGGVEGPPWVGEHVDPVPPGSSPSFVAAISRVACGNRRAKPVLIRFSERSSIHFHRACRWTMEPTIEQTYPGVDRHLVAEPAADVRRRSPGSCARAARRPFA